MAINVSQAFHRTSANPVDESMALTKTQMLAVNDNLMPAYYFTICQDDGEIYLYDKTATPSSTTGKFTKFEAGGGGDVSGRALSESIAPIFDDTEAYSEGDRVMYEDRLYKFNTDHAAGDWDDTEVDEVDVDAEIPELMPASDIPEVASPMPSVMSRRFKYSTEEQVVGEWINGKPLYQKTIQTTLPSGSTIGTMAMKNVSIGASVDFGYVVESFISSGGSNFSMLYMDNDKNGVTKATINNNNNSQNPNCIVLYASRWFDTTCYITIRYTKTTD